MNDDEYVRLPKGTWVVGNPGETATQNAYWVETGWVDVPFKVFQEAMGVLLEWKYPVGEKP